MQLTSVRCCRLFLLVFWLLGQHANGQLTDFFRIRFLNSNNYSDEAIVRFRSDATRGFDPDYDAFKLNGIVINVSTLPDSTLNLSINAMPMVLAVDSVFLRASGPVGNYRLVFTQLTSFTTNTAVYLIDRFNEDQRLINNGDTVAFSITGNPLSNSWKRFVLRFVSPTRISFQESRAECSLEKAWIVKKGDGLPKAIFQDFSHLADLAGKRYNLSTSLLTGLPTGTYLLLNEADLRKKTRILLID